MLHTIHPHTSKMKHFFLTICVNITSLQTASDKGNQHSKKCKDNLFHNHKTEITLFTLESFVLSTVYSALD